MEYAKKTFQEPPGKALWEYQRLFERVFGDIGSCRIEEAADEPLQGSHRLVSSVTALGLHHNDEKKYTDRLQSWENFNLCWQALGQKQKDMISETLETGRQPADILSADTIKSLMDDLVDIGDKPEPYSLVDFEMGFWEEEIIHVLTECLDDAHGRRSMSVEREPNSSPVSADCSDEFYRNFAPWEGG
ncbi:uncharacterized protein A1O5_09538 [Cladophialophora psammophila CBS 110553]|uniref:Uncharacterized protein n=1 Tax=Cladophialophora psammophila CBS 110553 TaxID=1182543 RepID=W9WRA7_9EURO|nr:uncharacterized protein A1O5_09538 [Cladophialophora psammophila CBS 110553]EXJ67525.1 hypothetical protein A1O5_09538 [Cladophialophora psammophila CBS 110553]